MQSKHLFSFTKQPSPTILMSTTPLSSTILGHFYTSNEKFNLTKTIGILIGFAGIVFLFSDNLLINESIYCFRVFTGFQVLNNIS